MVFESIVVELVNRFLGDYVDNLDKSQLSIGLWGGQSYGFDVVCVLQTGGWSGRDGFLWL